MYPSICIIFFLIIGLSIAQLIISLSSIVFPSISQRLYLYENIDSGIVVLLKIVLPIFVCTIYFFIFKYWYYFSNYLGEWSHKQIIITVIFSVLTFLFGSSSFYMKKYSENYDFWTPFILKALSITCIVMIIFSYYIFA
jgi:hypothetical protein